MSNIPVFDYLQQYSGLKTDILQAIESVLDSGQLILGKQGRLFEESFTNFLGGKGHSVGVNSGTDALAIALMALGVKSGDEVVTVPNTAVPTVSAICSVGARPVFCDVDENTALMNIEKLPSCITDKTKAVIPVHLYGNVVDIPEVRSVLSRQDIYILEDCAQAHAASLDGKMVGTMGDIAAFSFYPTKNLGAYGDAGLCYSLDEKLGDEMKKIRMYGFNGTPYSERAGLNSRMDEVQAAVLNVKLPYLNSYIDKRRHLAGLYEQLLTSAVDRFSSDERVRHAYHLYVISLTDRDEVRNLLKEKGIDTGVHYQCPIHLMDAYKYLGYVEGDLPKAEKLAKKILTLPLYPELSESEVREICCSINQIFQ